MLPDSPHAPLLRGLPTTAVALRTITWGRWSFERPDLHTIAALGCRVLVHRQRSRVDDDAIVARRRLRRNVAPQHIESHFLDGTVNGTTPATTTAGLAGDDIVPTH